MIEFIIGAVIVISIVVYLIANRKTESENKEINSTVLPLPPKPPTGTPKQSINNFALNTILLQANKRLFQ